jgi:hypothetical protein
MLRARTSPPSIQTQKGFFPYKEKRPSLKHQANNQQFPVPLTFLNLPTPFPRFKFFWFPDPRDLKVSAKGSGAKFKFHEDLFERDPRRVPFQRFRAVSFILPADYAHVWSSFQLK